MFCATLTNKIITKIQILGALDLNVTREPAFPSPSIPILPLTVVGWTLSRVHTLVDTIGTYTFTNMPGAITIFVQMGEAITAPVHFLALVLLFSCLIAATISSPHLSVFTGHRNID